MMIKKTVSAFVLSAAVPLLAAEPAGVVVWPSAELKAYAKKLVPKMNERKSAFERLATFGKP